MQGHASVIAAMAENKKTNFNLAKEVVLTRGTHEGIAIEFLDLCLGIDYPDVHSLSGRTRGCCEGREAKMARAIEKRKTIEKRETHMLILVISCQLLLDAGADSHIATAESITPLMIAYYRDHLNIAKLFGEGTKIFAQPE